MVTVAELQNDSCHGVLYVLQLLNAASWGTEQHTDKANWVRRDVLKLLDRTILHAEKSMHENLY